jgi:hypothetical protein
MNYLLINERSLAILNLIDAFKLTESELKDVWDGVFNRIAEANEVHEFSGADKPLTNEVVEELLEDHPEYPIAMFEKIGFDDPMIYVCDLCEGSGYIETFEDDIDFECPRCGGSGTLDPIF